MKLRWKIPITALWPWAAWKPGLEVSHEVMNEPFYTGVLLVKRLSGALDRLPVTVPGKLLAGDVPQPDQLVMVQGQVRSYNKVVEGAGRLMVTLFAAEPFSPAPKTIPSTRSPSPGPCVGRRCTAPRPSAGKSAI